jgi:hypothetical protein
LFLNGRFVENSEKTLSWEWSPLPGLYIVGVKEKLGFQQFSIDFVAVQLVFRPISIGFSSGAWVLREAGFVSRGSCASTSLSIGGLIIAGASVSLIDPSLSLIVVAIPGDSGTYDLV